MISVAFSPDGRTLAAMAATIARSGCGTWPILPAPPASASPSPALRTAPNRSRSTRRSILAVGAGDGKVWLWNLADPARPARLGQPLTGPPAVPGTGINSVAFSPDGKIFGRWRPGLQGVAWNLADPARPARLGQPLTGPLQSPDRHQLGRIQPRREDPGR